MFRSVQIGRLRKHTAIARRLIQQTMLAGVVLFSMSGCAASNPQPAPKPSLDTPVKQTTPTPVTKTPSETGAIDPCATNLHDICGAILFWLIDHDQLPQQVEELQKLPGFEKLLMACPVSHDHYVYTPTGLIIPNETARVILYDSKPAHGGIRWAIRVIPVINNQPAVAIVFPMDEPMFKKLQAP